METKFKGTQGKWVISPSSENYIADISDNFAIAKAFNNSFIQKGECEANTKLIANAPELLEQLIYLEDYVNRSLTLSGLEKKDIDFILKNPREVIEKTLT